jgi:hypothetical protein
MADTPTPTPRADGPAPQAAGDVETPPFILISPSIKLGPPATAVEIKCSTHQISHGIDQNSNDYETFCGSYRVYGAAHETITLTVYQNFDPTGPWAVLSPLRGQTVEFELLPDDRVAASPTNPKMTGVVRVPAMPFIDAAVNEASEIDVELAIQGTPVFVTA